MKLPSVTPLLLAATLLAVSTVAAGAECAAAKAEWIFCEDFEGPTFLSQWQEVAYRERKVRETNRPFVYEGSSSLKLIFPPTGASNVEDGAGWMHRWWAPAPGQNELYMRWYVRYSRGFNYGNWDVKMAGLEGHMPGVRYRPGAGVVPDGTWFQSRVVSLGVYDDRGQQEAKSPFFYYYHPDQVTQWGDFGFQNQSRNVALEDERWYCIEMRVKENTVTGSPGGYAGQYDGEQTLWIDGIVRARYSGIRWRTHPDVHMNDLYHSAWVGQPRSTQEQYRWEDNYVISTKPVGCLNFQAPGRPTGLTVR